LSRTTARTPLVYFLTRMSTPETSDVFQSVVETSGARVYWLILGLISTFITARYLGPEGRGLYAAAVSWAGLAYAVLHLSLAPVVVYVAAGRPSEAWLPNVAGTTI